MSWTCAFSRGRSDQVASAGGRLWLCIGSASVALGSRSAQEVKRMPARYVSKQQHAPPQPQTICTAALARSPLERRKGLFRRRDGDEAADRRPHAPSGTDAASDSRNADHLATPSLISASTGGPTRGPIPVRSAVRFWQKFRAAARERAAAWHRQAPHPAVASESARSPSSQSSPFGAPSPRLAPQYAHALAVCAASAPSLRAQYTPLQ